jgi:3-oxoadipate enol-lactonase
MPFIHFNKADIYYEVMGKGKTNILSRSRITYDHSDWGLQEQNLRANFKVINFDLRGHGWSTFDKPECDIETLAEDINCLIGKVRV